MPRIRSIASDLEGSVSVVAALMMTVVMGGLALTAETGYWYMEQRKLQHAADVAAHAGAIRLMQGDDEPQIEAAATHVAQITGYEAGTFTLNLLSAPPRVEVILGESKPRLLTAMFGQGDIQISARAVAKVDSSGSRKACVLALNPTVQAAVSVGGSAGATFNGCDVVSNSNSAQSLDLDGANAGLSVDCASVVGGVGQVAGVDLNVCPSVLTSQRAVADPYAGLAEPVLQGACINGNVGTGAPNSKETVTATEPHPSGVLSRWFCKGLSLKGTVTFSPGLYMVSGGDMTINADSTIIGTGVTFYIAAGSSVKFTGGATLTLTAPSDPSPYAGILFFGSRANTGEATITGGTGSTLQGAIYMPTMDVKYSGSSAAGSNACTQIIADTITFVGGNSSLSPNCESLGGETIWTNQQAVLIE